MTAAPTTVPYTPNIGDIFRCSWGYDQTNVDYYEVVSVSASRKTVHVLKVGAKFVSQGGPAGNRVRPVAGSYLEEWVREPTEDDPFASVKKVPAPARKLIQVGYQGQPYIKAYSFANAYLWEGTDDYETDIMFGH